MPRPFLSGLRGRLILLVLLAVLPAFALTWYTGWEDRQRQRASVADDTVAFARIVANDQERAIDGTRQVLSDLAAIPEVRAGNPERSRTYFTVLMKLYHGYTSFSVIAPDGSVLVSLPAAERPTSFSTRVWFEQALSTKTFAVGDYQTGQLTGKHIVVAAWPVVDEQGRVVSVLAAGLDVTWLNQIAATAQLPSGTVLALVDRRGVIVARYPETAGALGRGFPEAALIASMRQRDEGTVELTGEDGVPRVYAFTPVGGRLETGLRMAVGVPMDVAYGAVNRVQRRHWLVLFMATVLTLLAAWYAAERFVLRRVSSLLDATRKLAGGDPAARTRLPYDHGELSDLARAFDEMAASLQARQVERDQAERALRESEERFRAFMDNSPALAFVRTDAGEMVYANATLERHFGLGPGGWRGQPPSRLWSPGLADRLARDDAHVLSGGVPEESVDTVVLADGRERYWLTVTFPLADAGGRLLSATLAFDLTEWRQIQARLARAERRYTQLVDQASDGIAIADADLRLVEVNAAVCRMTGYSRDELLERTVGDLLMPDELETLQASRDAVRAGRAIVTERRVRRKDGTVLHVEVSARPFENGGVQAIIRDVSTRREAEQALRESEERFRLLYQYLPLAYHSVSEQGTIVMVNDAWLALTGLSRGRAVGRRFTDLLTRESAAVYETRFVRADRPRRRPRPRGDARRRRPVAHHRDAGRAAGPGREGRDPRALRAARRDGGPPGRRAPAGERVALPHPVRREPGLALGRGLLRDQALLRPAARPGRHRFRRALHRQPGRARRLRRVGAGGGRQSRHARALRRREPVAAARGPRPDPRRRRARGVPPIRSSRWREGSGPGRARGSTIRSTAIRSGLPSSGRSPRAPSGRGPGSWSRPWTSPTGCASRGRSASRRPASNGSSGRRRG